MPGTQLVLNELLLLLLPLPVPKAYYWLNVILRMHTVSSKGFII